MALGCLLLITVPPLLICSGVATWWFGRQTMARMEFEDKVRELRGEGLPFDGDSLDDYRAERTDPTDAERWMEILDTLSSEEYQKSTQGVPIVGTGTDPSVPLPGPGEAWQYEDPTRKFLDQWNETRTDLATIAIGTGPIRTDTVYRSINTDLGYVQAHRSAARLMALNHRLAVQQVDGQECYRSVMAMLGTARALESEPLVMSQLVRCAIAGAAMSSLRRSTQYNLFSGEEMRDIDEQLATFDDYSKTYEIGIIGERVMMLTAFEDPNVMGHSLNPLGMRYKDVLNSMKWFDKAQEVGKKRLNPSNFLDEVPKVRQEFETAMQQYGFVERMDNTLTSLFFPAMEAFGNAALRTAMQSRLARTALRIRLYQRQFGRWPESTDVLSDIEGLRRANLRPSGPTPRWGYRVEGNNAYLWGFVPTASTDQPPPEPIKPGTPEAAESPELEEWNWVLEG